LRPSGTKWSRGYGADVDIVLSDLKMPGMDGVALTRHLVSTFPHTPILVMTAYAADDVKTLSELRVPCLSKPLSLEKLKSEIQTVLSFQANHS
jgi:CheY-like chemotaxis protein